MNVPAQSRMMLLLATEHSWDCDVVCRGRASIEAKPCGTFGHYYCARTSVRSVCPQGTNSYTSYIHEWVSSLSSLNIGQATSRPDSHWILYTCSMHACSKLLSLKNIGDDMQKKGHQTSLVIVIMGLNVEVHSPSSSFTHIGLRLIMMITLGLNRKC